MRTTLHPAERFDVGFTLPDAFQGLGAAHRAGLGRGLALVLALTMSCLVIVYAPLACCGSGRVDVGAPSDPRPAPVSVTGLAAAPVSR